MYNGVPVGMIKKFGKKKAGQIYPFEKDVNQIEELKKLMNEDPAFKPGMVLVEGKLIHRSELNGNSNAT